MANSLNQLSKQTIFTIIETKKKPPFLNLSPCVVDYTYDIDAQFKSLCFFYREAWLSRLTPSGEQKPSPTTSTRRTSPACGLSDSTLAIVITLCSFLPYFSMKLLFKVLNKICFLCSRVGQNLCIRCQVAVGDKNSF